MAQKEDSWKKFKKDLSLDLATYADKHGLCAFMQVAKLRKEVAKHRASRIDALLASGAPNE